MITRSEAGAFGAVLQAHLAERLGGRSRKAALVALSHPGLASAALYWLPRALAVAPVRRDLLLHECAAILERIDPGILVTDSADSLIAQAASIRGLPIALMSAPAGGMPHASDSRIRIVGGSRRSPAGRDYPRGTAIVLQTSGTTGAPKIVALTWSNLDRSVANVIRSLGLGPDDRTIAVMPLTHIHGIVAVLHAALESGGALLAATPLDPAAFWRSVPEFRPTWLSLVPSLLGAICDEAPGEAGPHGEQLRFIRTASSKLPPSLRKRAETLFGVPILEAYGMTEACHQVTSSTLAMNRPGSVGQAGPEPAVAIRDLAGQPLPAGETGEICIRGRNLFSGYLASDAAPRRWWRSASATSPTHWGRWFRTGDLGRIDQDGYLWIDGRIKEQINRGGETLSPVEIEDAILSLPGIRAAAVFPLPHPTLGEEVAAICVPEPGTAVSEHRLIEQLSALLSFEKLPKTLFLVDALPKSAASGKVSRLALAEHYARSDPFGALQDGQTELRSPSIGGQANTATPHDGDIEALVSSVFHDVLGTGDIDRDRSFFAVGGTSLKAARVMAAIERQCGVRLPLSTIVTHPTVSLLSQAVAAALSRRSQSSGGSIPAGAVGEPALPLPGSLVDFCVALAFDPARDDLQQSFVVDFGPAVQPADLERALADLAGDQTALRCVVRPIEEERFAFVDAGPVRPAVLIHEGVVESWGDSAALIASMRAALPLDHAPLLRVSAQALAKGGWAYAFTVSELILDGYSRLTFLADLAGRLAGHANAAEEDHFAGILRRMLERQAAAPVAGTDASETHRLPFDRNAEPGLRAGKAVRVLGGGAWDRVAALARDAGATPFAVLLTLFASVLDRVSGGPVEILVSMQRRQAPGEFRTIGNFVERVPISVRPAMADRLVDIARDTTAGLLTAFEQSPHRSVRFSEHIVTFEVEDELDVFISRGAGETAAGAWMVERLGSMTMDPVPPLRPPSALSLAIKPGIADRQTGPGQVTLTYDAGLFSPARADAILDAYLHLLERAAADPGLVLAASPLTSAGTAAAPAFIVPVEVGAPTAATTGRLDEIFSATARRQPEADALTFPGGALSFKRLDDCAARIAAALRETADPTGRPVMFWERAAGSSPNPLAGWSPLYAAASLAILKAQAVVVPIGGAMPDSQVADLAVSLGVETIASRLVEMPGDLAGLYGPAGCVETPVGNLNLFRRSGSPAGPALPAGMAYVMHSSGTTGRPKSILQSHRSLIRLVEALIATGIWPDSDAMPGNDISFDVFTAVLWLSWSSGRAVHSPGRFDISATALADLRRAGVRSFMTSPTIAALLINQDPDCFSPFDVVVLTGEELPVSLAERLLATPGKTLFANFYGPTETTVWASCDVLAAPVGERVPIGRALEGYRIEIAETRSLLPLPKNLPGEILIATPDVPPGYFGNPDANRLAFIDRIVDGERRTFYRSGDVGWVDAAGKLHYAGRLDRQIQIAGLRVELSGIEAVLASVEGVSQAAVVDISTPSGPYLAAFIVPDSRRADPDALIRAAMQGAERRLPSFSVPRFLTCLDRLPTTRSGKVDLAGLRKQAGEARSSGDRSRTVPADTVEAGIAAIWSDLLGKADLHLDDDFQKVGGTSLGLMRLAVRLQTRFAVPIAVAELFFKKTIAEQAELVRSRQRRPDEPGAGAWPKPAHLRGDGLYLTSPRRSGGAGDDRPWLVGMPTRNGRTSGVGPLGRLLHHKYDFCFIEATAEGGQLFTAKDWSAIADETWRCLEGEVARRGKPPILCGYSFGGWLSWFAERVWVERFGKPGPRVINLDCPPFHLTKPHLFSDKCHDRIARAEGICGTDMLLVCRDDAGEASLVGPTAWRRVVGQVVLAPRARTVIHMEIPAHPIVDAAAPFVERWVEGDQGDDWPPFLDVEQETAGQIMSKLLGGRSPDCEADYNRLRREFISKDGFDKRMTTFEIVAAKHGDRATVFELARRHYLAQSASRYAVLKWLTVLRLQGKLLEATRIAAIWLERHPDDQLAKDIASGSVDPMSWSNRPEGGIAIRYRWWAHLLGEAGRASASNAGAAENALTA